MSHFNPVYEAVELSEGFIHAAPNQKEPIVSNTTDHLPAKSFIAVQQPQWKRALWQTFIGVALLLAWITIAFGFFFGINYGLAPSCIDDTFTIFSPDSLYGNFTLGEARFIDISFNLVAGRGLQTTFGIFAYRVHTDILMRMMESTPVSFELFCALSFQPSHVRTIWPVIKAFVTLPGWRPRFIMGWILFSALFFVALPTLMDTMTGYIQIQDYSVSFNDREIIPLPSMYTYNDTEISVLQGSHGGGSPQFQCSPDKDGGYQWGFATVWVLITWIVLGFWTLGTYSVWMDAQHHSELRRKGRTINPYRAVADMAEAMTEALGPNMAPYSGNELEKHLKSRGGVMYYSDVDEVTGLGKVGLSARKRTPMRRLSWNVVYGNERE